MEHVFNLSTIAETRQKLGLDTFAVFIDFKKAYDSIQHSLLWQKLENISVPYNVLKVLQGLYTNLTCCVKVNEWITGSFNATQGLRQGCILSPTLFNIFMNDLPKHLKAAFGGIQFGDINICCLLYADDLVLLADSVQNVQTLLQHLEDWCRTWKISINHTKSAVIHFRPQKSPCSSEQFLFGGLYLPIVTQYKYLGIVFDELLTFKPAAENRLEQASKSFWTIECVLSTLPGEAFKILFEAMVASVLDYGAPMWSHSVSPNERLQQHACRCFLGVGRKHALAALAGDMCWMPTSRRHQIQTIMFWISITQLNDNRIAKKVYKAAKISADTAGIENWPHRVKQLLSECNLLQWWKEDMCSNLSKTECKNMVNSILFRLERTEWWNKVMNKPKLKNSSLSTHLKHI